MAGKLNRKEPKKGTAAQVQALEEEYSRLEEGEALKAGCEDGTIVYAVLPDEVKESLNKVDFSILNRDLMEVNILDSDSAIRLPPDQLRAYLEEQNKTLRFYIQAFMDVSQELANAQELILNQQNTIFGRSTQRTSALIEGKKNGGKTGKADEKQENEDRHEPAGSDTGETTQAGKESTHEETSPSGTGIPEEEVASGSPSGPTGEESGQERKGQPKRSAGCAEKVYQDAEVCHIDCTIPESKLDGLFGSSGWKELPGAERKSTEYTIIPAKIIIKIFHLHAYCSADCTDPGVKGVVRAKLPIVRPRAKSPMSSGLWAYILHERNSMRIPVERICDDFSSSGFVLTPQRVYENLRFYDRYFRILEDLLWTILLSSHYIQVDETPVRYYDKTEGKMKRGYLWVFTTSEMLLDGKPITLFYFAEGRDAGVLRHCLGNFTGVLGSDGHNAYQAFARDSGGTIINAGCLDHFRKRVVSALRAIPNLKQMTEEEKLGIPAYVIMLKLNEVFRLERKTKKLATKEERDTYRNGLVRNAFEDLVQTTLGIDITACPAKSYTYDAIRYMQNQEVFLDQFLEDGNIASNNSKCERKFAFFAILRNQVKMFGSMEGARIAARLESIEQTAREHIKDTRIYYQFLFDEFIPFVKRQEPDTDFVSLPELADYLPWSEKNKEYRETILERERILISIIENF